MDFKQFIIASMSTHVLLDLNDTAWLPHFEALDS